MSEIIDLEYCVTCPLCGKISQKTYMIDSNVKCSRCGYHYLIHVADGITITMDASCLERMGGRKKMLTYAKALEKLKMEMALAEG